MACSFPKVVQFCFAFPFMVHFELIVTGYEFRGQVHFFAYERPIAGASFVERALPSSGELDLHLCQKSAEHISVRLFLGSLSCIMNLNDCVPQPTPQS